MALKKLLMGTTLVLSGLAASNQAQAFDFTFDATGDTLTYFYNSTTSTGVNLLGSVTYTLDSLAGKVATFSVSATNGTNDVDGSARLVSFGVDVVTPTLIGASTDATTTTEWNATINTNFPAFHEVDLCSYAGTNCSGGASDGVLEGATDTFDLKLTFDSVTLGGQGSGTGITFTSPFPSKWQSVGLAGKSFEVDGCFTDRCDSGPPNEIPEPGTLALAGLGLLTAAALRRRKG
jgi:hypothetical protein